MEQLTVKAERRETSGKGISRKLRQQGRIPGVFYGRSQEAIPIHVDSRDFENMLSKLESSNILINLQLDGKDQMALIQALQRGPVQGKILHADFYHVAKDQKITIKIPVNFVGTAKGVKEDGGIQQVILRSLEVRCLPADIPANVDLDVSHMEIGDSIHVSEVDLPGVELLTDLRRTIVTIIPPTVLKVAAAAAEEGEEVEGEGVEGEEAEEGKEPEVIGEKKEEDAEEK
ncbi:MAG: 50S ribosomal protein L25/general stress protein Ctc [candidate division Zixibacteria bacterium]|nr:50S ribosomal protein L25/general stress protein Ctc [candidate division Zixibacteria bacterium]